MADDNDKPDETDQPKRPDAPGVVVPAGCDRHAAAVCDS